MTLGRPSPERRAARSWANLRERIRSIPPQSVGRGLIAAGLGLGVLWMALASWPALAPYVVGGVIGYAALPLVNRLDRFMPRVLAAILALLAVVGLIALFVWAVVPPLLAGLGRLADLIPRPDDVSGSLGDIESWLAGLPEPLASTTLRIFRDVVAGLQGALEGVNGAVTSFIVAQTLGILSTINFVFGLFVLPVWITSLMTSERIARNQAFTFLPQSARPDALAVARIVDRSAATFLRARLLLAVLTGLLTFGGLAVASQFGIESTPRGQVAIAALLGVLQLIPELGFLLGFLPVGLVLAVLGPGPGVVLGAVYVAAVWLSGRLAETRVRGGARDLHPVILIPAIVAMSQFGLIWLFLAAPVVGTIVDLARYAWGRLANPPMPANVLPGEEARSAVAAAPIPAAYRTLAAKQGVTNA